MVEKKAANISIFRMKGWLLYALPVFVYIFATLATDAFFMGDSADYVDSIIAHQHGKYYLFWEFGHLLWRPLGWAVAEILQPVTSWVVGPFPRAGVFLTLICINWAAGLLCVIFLVYFLKIFCKNGLIIGMTIIGFIFSQGILNHAQTGLSYVPGLAFLLLGICFISQENLIEKNHLIQCLVAGLSFSIAVGFWFLYIFAIPAAILFPLIFYKVNSARVKIVTSVAATFFFCTFFLYMFVLYILRIDTFDGVKNWILDAGHGLEIRGFARVVFGLTRTFVNMGNDGMIMKRFLIGDIYNPVSFVEIFFTSLWKVAFFYLFLIILFKMLIKTRQGTRLLSILLLTAPIFIFAYFFNPSDIERYIALYPFFFLCIAYAFENTSFPSWAKVFPIIFISIVVVSNSRAMFAPFLALQQERVLARLGDFTDKIPIKSRIFVVHGQDELQNFQRAFPIHPANLDRSFIISPLVLLGSNHNKSWREEFSKRALAVWSQGGEVWLSDRALKQRPDSDWNWVEGDDKNISWKEFPAFFSNVKLGTSSGGPDGFHLILPTEENKKLMQFEITSKEMK